MIVIIMKERATPGAGLAALAVILNTVQYGPRRIELHDQCHRPTKIISGLLNSSMPFVRQCR